MENLFVVVRYCCDEFCATCFCAQVQVFQKTYMKTFFFSSLILSTGVLFSSFFVQLGIVAFNRREKFDFSDAVKYTQ